MCARCVCGSPCSFGFVWIKRRGGREEEGEKEKGGEREGGSELGLALEVEFSC